MRRQPLTLAQKLPANPRRQWLRALTAAATGTGFWCSGAGAQGYAQRNITLLVPFGPGGIADLIARTVAQAMSPRLGQSIVIDNRPSAGSIVASRAAAEARPDGHTLLLMSNGHAVAPAVLRQLPYDAQSDFAPVSLLARFDLALFVPAGSAFKSLPDWLAQARAQPGRLTLGTVAVGSSQHLAAEWLKQMAGIDLLLVPYKTSPALLGALRGGQIDAAVEILGPWQAQLQAGALRALAVTGAQRFGGLPQVPTVAEAEPRLQAYAVSSWNGLAAPTGTPEAVLAELNQAANAALAQPQVIASLKALGVAVQGGPPERLSALLASETRRWALVARAAGIRPT